MAYKWVIYEKEGNIAKITMNKPEKLNALGTIGPEEDFAEVLKAFKEAEDDDDVKVIILKGAGRAFTSGQDLSRVGFVYGWEQPKPGERPRRPSQRIRLKKDRGGFEGMRSIFLCPKFTVAQMHGLVVEFGVILGLMCDFAIATEDAQLSFPGQRLGFAGGGEPTFPFLVLTVGLKRAMDIYVTGRTVTGKEAAEIGLVTKAVPSHDLEEAVNRYAKALCLLPRDGIALGKATRHQFYDQLSLTNAFTTGYIHHTMFTNLRWEPDEWNFFKTRRDKGAKEAFHERDARFTGLV